jgi:undecaprenyl-phosphate 4-deoxy-4-formamido-L-arabinose transferase
MPNEVSVVVPVFGDGGDLRELADRVARVLNPASPSWELIFVNDGSPLGSAWETVEDLCRRHANVRGIDLQRNFGQHNALLAGIRAARGDVIVTLDDDLQHPIDDLPRLLAALDGADVVYGRPTNRVSGLSRSIAGTLSRAALASVLGAGHARDIAPFRAFRGSLRDVFANYEGPNVSIDVLLGWVTARIAAVDVVYQPRRHGRSGYGFWRLLGVAVTMVTGFSVWPLRVASIVGLTFALFGGVVLAFVLARYLTFGSPVPGFPFLASIVAIFSGAQLFSLGVIGEYLARMYFRTMNRPPYVVRRTANLHAHERA